MSSSYPGSLDAFATNRTSGQTIQASTDNDHSDAINKIEAELGVNPSGSESTVAARFTAVEDLIGDAGATIPFYFDLFGPSGGDGLSLPTGNSSYVFLTGVTASTKLLVEYLTGTVVEASAEVIWTPNDADNGIKFLSMDGVTGGVPDNPDTMAEFTGVATATPIVSNAWVTADMQAIWEGASTRYIGFQFKTDAAVAPVLFAARIWVTVEIGGGGGGAANAESVSFAPNGSISSTNVQAAIQEVRDEAGSGNIQSNVFNGTSWPSRPVTSDIVLWVGGGSGDDPSADLEDGDLWFPSEA
jgi:hypothetical protein